MHWLLIYALGLGTAAAAKAAGPSVGRVVRPVARNLIKGGLVVGRELQRTTEEARASLEDLTAEAREEIESADGASKRPAV